ncbi:hypothetical protein BBH99_06380 [Chryseobacterium contaminans]|uniref:Uncharacterized protein n=2 Tax=Chryseobacterium contaminans TaxID=1423959 RepID=A0ABX2X8Z5_9FLAO|nr:hypothetical protein BBH99_06380 [Chryseobacterium contaminans]
MLMTTLNIVDYLLPVEECRLAADEWSLCRSNYPKIKDLIPTTYVFTISDGPLEWMKSYKDYPEFCATIGIWNGQLILIFYPMNEKGDRIDQREYPYCTLAELTNDVKLQEIQEYTIVKNSILSKGLEKIEKNADMAFPISNQPILEQDKAIEAIESWRESGMDWFYKECNESKGIGIFKRFYVPTADLCLSDEGLREIKCSFGLKYNDVYGKMLVTLIFISFRENLQNAERAQMMSNTYDWAKPCPPICRIPGMEGEF